MAIGRGLNVLSTASHHQERNNRSDYFENTHHPAEIPAGPPTRRPANL